MKTRSKHVVSVIFSAIFATSMLSMSGFANAGDDCSCRFKGQDIPTGKSICMKTSKGLVMAKCDWVLNNTAWKFTDQPCPYSMLNQTPVDAKTLKTKIKKFG
ncbi:MAG: hypothetical protein QM488_00340 [Rhizobiaceae bacterium]